jgi:hypothetical protein
MEVSGQLHASAALLLSKDPPLPTGPQSRSERGGVEKKIPSMSLPGTEARREIKKKYCSKSKLSLCVTKYHAMITHGRVEAQFRKFLTAVPGGVEWSVRPVRFTPGERDPGTNPAKC